MFSFFRKREIEKLTETVKSYISENYQEPKKTSSDEDDGIRFSRSIKPELLPDIKFSLSDAYDEEPIDNALRGLSSSESSEETKSALERNRNMSFVDKMLEFINANHLRDSEVYKAAQIDRRLFSKIVSERTYKPSKDTCIALSLAIKLSLSEANDMLERAGYALSHSIKRDIVVEFCFKEQVYDLNEVNAILFKLGEKPFGR